MSFSLRLGAIFRSWDDMATVCPAEVDMNDGSCMSVGVLRVSVDEGGCGQD